MITSYPVRLLDHLAQYCLHCLQQIYKISGWIRNELGWEQRVWRGGSLGDRTGIEESVQLSSSVHSFWYTIRHTAFFIKADAWRNKCAAMSRLTLRHSRYFPAVSSGILFINWRCQGWNWDLCRQETCSATELDLEGINCTPKRPITVWSKLIS